MFSPTQIIATIGPATENVATMQSLLKNGVDIFRYNFSHSSYQWAEHSFAKAREASQATGMPLKLLLGTRGPEIRTGDLTHPIHFTKGEVLTLTLNEEDQDPANKILFVSYPGIMDDIEPGNIIELDNGRFPLKVLTEQSTQFTVQVLASGELGSRKHINLPGIRVGLPTISEQDEADIRFGLQNGIDILAISFVRSDQDIKRVREICQEENRPEAAIYGKIENSEGVQNFDQILNAADGIMIARGDLGVEVPFESLPSLQKKMLKKIRRANKFSIVATHMLESMVRFPMPTRAEVSDVATAVWDGADAVMLSEETAIGSYPLAATEVMDKVVTYTEQELERMWENEVRL